VSHHIIFITACAQNVLQQECKWWMMSHSQTACSITADQSSSPAVDASFHFVSTQS